MDWIRENKTLAGIVGVIVAGVLGLGYVLFGAWSSYSAIKEQYLAQGNQIAAIKGMALAPTPKNLADKKALVDEYANNVNQLGKALLILQDRVAPQPTKDNEFQAKLKKQIIEIKQKAAALKVQLPAEFAFGFGEYTGNLPNMEAATELSGYLDGVEALVKLFMDSKVISIDLLERSVFSGEKDGKSADAKKSSAGQKPAAPQSQASSGITDRRTVSIIATLDQGALQTLMSRLANPADMPHFASVRLLRIENQTREGPVSDSVTIPEPEPVVVPNGDAPPAKEDDKKPAVAVTAEVKAPPPAPVDSVPVMGQELLKIQIEIDLIKFLDSARGVATAPAPGAVRPVGQ